MRPVPPCGTRTARRRARGAGATRHDPAPRLRDRSLDGQARCWQELTVHARLAAIVLAVLVPCCRRPVQPHAAGMVVSVTARLLPAAAAVREVVASAGGGATA